MRITRISLFCVSVLWVIACTSGATDPSATPGQSAPTPEVQATAEVDLRGTLQVETPPDATMEARVAATVTAATPVPTTTPTSPRPTDTPSPSPTPKQNTTAELGSPIGECDRALALDADARMEWSHRPQRTLSSDQYHSSIESCNRVIELDPNNAQAYMSRGYAYVRTGQDLRAIEDFNSAIQLDPGNAVFYARRGYGYAQLEQFLRAIEDYNRAIELDPDNAVFYYGRGYAYSELGENRLAKADYDKTKEINPNLDLPSYLGLYRKGRTLHFSVVSLERTRELRYSTVDPEGVVRRWSLSPSEEGLELVLVRARVENHTAGRVLIDVDRTAAELRDSTNTTYLPLTITQTVWRDFRGEQEALVRMDLGQCFDGTRALIDVGATVRWRSEDDKYQYIAFEDTRIAVGPDGRVDIAPGASLTHTFGQAGMYPYSCGNLLMDDWPALIYAVFPSGDTDFLERSTQFIQGAFELLQGYGLDGYLVFEVPIGVEFLEMRWQAGDSITFTF